MRYQVNYFDKEGKERTLLLSTDDERLIPFMVRRSDRKFDHVKSLKVIPRKTEEVEQ